VALLNAAVASSGVMLEADDADGED
jgi:hypothetical protein